MKWVKKRRGTERNKKEEQFRLMPSLFEGNKEALYCVYCSRSTKWNEYGRSTEAIAV